MPQVSPQAAAQNWVRQMGAATQKITAGVNAVTEAPTAKAARRIDAMVAGIQRAAADGKIKRGLERVTLEDWKREMLEKGVGRIASGAAASQGKMADFMTDFLPHVYAGRDAIDREMPRGDTEQNIQRAVAMMRHNAKFKRTR